MAYTVQDIVDGARSILQDTISPYRYSDADLVSAVNYAVLSLNRLRPDLAFGNYPPSITALAIGDSFPYDDWYVPLMVTFVSGWAELRDDEYTEDKRAALLLAAFKPALQNG